MDAYTMTLAIIGAGAVSRLFMALVDKLDRPGK